MGAPLEFKYHLGKFSFTKEKILYNKNSSPAVNFIPLVWNHPLPILLLPIWFPIPAIKNLQSKMIFRYHQLVTGYRKGTEKKKYRRDHP